MTDKLTSTPFNPALAQPVGPAAPAAPARQAAPTTGKRFDAVLQQRVAQRAGMQFSSHAMQRLERRGIDLSDSQMQRLAAGVGKAAAKGSREAVVLVDQVAFLVGVPKRTVITAIDQQHQKDQVFTNIDTAVIA